MLEFDPQESHLEYMPAPEKPFDFDRKLKRLVGMSPNNVDPYLRFVWGMDVSEILDGQIVRRYPDPEGKYVGLDRWVLEGWQAPDVYDEAQWRANEEILGPYPTSGVWDFIAILEDSQQRYLPLGSKATQMAREWRHWKTKSKPRALADLIERRCRVQVLKEERWAEHKETILNEFVRDFSRAERGGYDPRNRTLVGKITEGEYREAPSGILIPKLA